MPHESHPVLLTRSELEFELVRGLQQVRRGMWRDANAKDQDKADRGWDAIARVLLARFDDLEVYKRPAGRSPGAAPG